MASPTRWTWVWVNSRSWCCDSWVTKSRTQLSNWTELNWIALGVPFIICMETQHEGTERKKKKHEKGKTFWTLMSQLRWNLWCPGKLRHYPDTHRLEWQTGYWYSVSLGLHWTLCRRAKLLYSCLILCNPLDNRLPGSSVHGILQARILEWIAMPSSRGSSQPRDQTRVFYVSCIGRRFFTTSSTWISGCISVSAFLCLFLKDGF